MARGDIGRWPRFKVGDRMMTQRSASRYIVFWASPPIGKEGRRCGSSRLATLADARAFGEAHPDWVPDAVWDAVSHCFVYWFRPVEGSVVLDRPDAREPRRAGLGVVE